jgi:uncharacterized protein YdhG (YjbR/CyaY superfamily)
MQSKAKTVEEYLEELPADRRKAMNELRNVILKNLPEGFKECMTYGMVGYVIPHSLYPPGYHVDPKLPLGLISIASQKNFIALYHMGIYGSPKLLKWFTDEYARQVKTRLDMGKACIRFKNPDQIPYKLVGELASKLTPADWIKNYEAALKP